MTDIGEAVLQRLREQRRHNQMEGVNPHLYMTADDADRLIDYVAELEARVQKQHDDLDSWVQLAQERGKRIAELEAMVAGGSGLIAAERQRQVRGWTPEHDDEHVDGYLAVAAGLLCLRNNDRWGLYHKHRDDRQRQLVIAGALIAAEIDRLARTAPKEPK